MPSYRELSVFGWIRLCVEQEFGLTIPISLKHICCSFFNENYELQESVVQLSRWCIEPHCDNSNGYIQGIRSWNGSNIFCSPSLTPNKGEYELTLRFVSQCYRPDQSLNNLFIIGICPESELLRPAGGNFCSFRDAYCICSSGVLMASDKKAKKIRARREKFGNIPHSSELMSGDIIHVWVNMNQMSVEFGVNGKRFHTAFGNIKQHQYVFAFASLFPCEIHINVNNVMNNSSKQ
eukprot:380213_1